MTASNRILILSSNTGGGHYSAAMALEESLLRISAGQVLVNIAHVLEDAHVVTRKFADLYNYLLRYHQHAMRYYYGAINLLKPYESLAIYQMCLKYGQQIIERVGPQVLVSVHPMTQHFFAYLLKTLHLTDKIPLITVVTDPCAGFWNGWACDAVQQYCVASESAKQQLIEYGVPSERIEITGMPVHSRFQPIGSLEQKMALRQELGFAPDKFTVLVNAGWVGGGNIPTLFESLLALNRPDLQLVFLAGKNNKLKAQAQRLAQNSAGPVQVLGYRKDMERLMNTADLMVSKLGGLTTFEAMASNLPILADCMTPPMPQEAGTATWISQNRTGELITSPQQIQQAVSGLMNNANEYEAMLNAVRGVGQVGAVDRITQKILASAPTHG